MTDKNKDDTFHQIHVKIPNDIYIRLREILDGSPLSILLRRLIVRYVEIYDSGKATKSKIDSMAVDVLRVDLEKCIIMEKEEEDAD
mgnify:CR=1 FL=1